MSRVRRILSVAIAWALVAAPLALSPQAQAGELEDLLSSLRQDQTLQELAQEREALIAATEVTDAGPFRTPGHPTRKRLAEIHRQILDRVRTHLNAPSYFEPTDDFVIPAWVLVPSGFLAAAILGGIGSAPLPFMTGAGLGITLQALSVTSFLVPWLLSASDYSQLKSPTQDEKNSRKSFRWVGLLGPVLGAIPSILSAISAKIDFSLANTIRSGLLRRKIGKISKLLEEEICQLMLQTPNEIQVRVEDIIDEVIDEEGLEHEVAESRSRNARSRR